MQTAARGPSVSNDDAYQGENLQEDARETNSNLQFLIEVIGGMLAASGDLLARLQQILGGGAQPAANESSEPGGQPTDGPDG
jgi:hypothetical protein